MTSVSVPVVRVWKVRVRVGQWLVAMRMRVAPGRGAPRVFVLVVYVVFVLMVMLLGRVGMYVRVLFGQMQPDPDAHQYGRRPERGRRVLLENGDRNGGADERRGGKVRAGARGA